MTFTPLDLSTWPRGQMFCYFSQMAPTGWSLTAELDVTALRAALKRRGRKFFPVYLWLVTRCLNRQIEFKVAEQEGRLGYFDTLTCHHAATDGYHVKLFLEELQADMDRLAAELN